MAENKNQNGKTKLKKGDTVMIIAGKDKSKSGGKIKKGKILFVDRKANKVVVEGVNIVTKHLKAGRQNQTGGIVRKEAPIHASNVMYLHKDKPTRLGYTVEENDGVKIKKRIAKTTGEVID